MEGKIVVKRDVSATCAIKFNLGRDTNLRVIVQDANTWSEEFGPLGGANATFYTTIYLLDNKII